MKLLFSTLFFVLAAFPADAILFGNTNDMTQNLVVDAAAQKLKQVLGGSGGSASAAASQQSGGGLASLLSSVKNVLPALTGQSAPQPAPVANVATPQQGALSANSLVDGLKHLLSGQAAQPQPPPPPPPAQKTGLLDSLLGKAKSLLSKRGGLDDVAELDKCITAQYPEFEKGQLIMNAAEDDDVTAHARINWLQAINTAFLKCSDETNEKRTAETRLQLRELGAFFKAADELENN